MYLQLPIHKHSAIKKAVIIFVDPESDEQSINEIRAITPFPIVTVFNKLDITEPHFECDVCISVKDKISVYDPLLPVARKVMCDDKIEWINDEDPTTKDDNKIYEKDSDIVPVVYSNDEEW
jgi:hypothetical protein